MKKVLIKNTLINLKKLLRTPQIFFAIIASIFGLVFIFVIPPFQNSDEPVHFYRAYQISDGGLISEKMGESAGGFLPASIEDIVHINQLGRYGEQIPFHENERYRLGNIKDSIKVRLDKDNEKQILFPSSAIYTPVPYAPHSIGILIANLFSAPPIIAFYLGRLFGLVFFIVSAFYIIKTTPRYKWAFVGLLLLPMTLVQATAITADTVLNIAVALFMSLILLANEKGLNKKQLALIGIASVAIVLSKQVFFLVLPLLFLIPVKVFKTKLRKLLFIFGIIAVSAASYFAFGGASGTPSAVNSTVGANISAQVEHITNNLVQIPSLFINTFLEKDCSGICLSLAGNFGWQDTPLPFVAVLIVYGLLFVIFFVRYLKPEDVEFRRNRRAYNVGVLTVAALLFGAICMALYLSWTAVGVDKIAGLQGRYFIPVLIVLSTVTISKLTIYIKEETYVNILRSLILIVLVSSVLTISARYIFA